MKPSSIHCILRSAFVLQTALTGSAFSVDKQANPGRRVIKHFALFTESELQNRRSFVSVIGGSAFCLVTLPSLSNASTKDSLGGKFILNNSQDGPSEIDATIDPFDLVDRIRTLWNRLESKYSQNGLVDYITIGADKDFEHVEKETAKLQNISMESMDDPTKMAFLINLYNVLIRIAFVIAGIPKNDLTRLSFFDTVAINIGENTYTLNDLENGLLRANSVPPYHLTKPFGKGDLRKDLSLYKTDPRIHFALNCGAKSCPPVRRYTPEGLEDELQAAALSFCDDESNVFIDETNEELRLSKIFKWYQSDFAISKSQLPFQLMKYVSDKKRDSLQQLAQNGNFEIDFVVYDWTTNDSRSKTFG
jgi:hypothetical protein